MKIVFSIFCALLLAVSGYAEDKEVTITVPESELKRMAEADKKAHLEAKAEAKRAREEYEKKKKEHDQKQKTEQQDLKQ